MYTITVIGGGAGGLMAAIYAKRHINARVVILEKNLKIGRKILLSGNGKCNFSNINTNKTRYNNPEFADIVLSQHGVDDTLKFFSRLGLMYTKDSEGRIYPLSQISATLNNLLIEECQRLGIEIITNQEVIEITQINGIYNIQCVNSVFLSDRVICATGGRAYGGKEEKTGDIYYKLNHSCTLRRPALVPLKVDKRSVKGLSGTRVKANACLIKDGSILNSERGEILFKDEGLSGIAIFNLSLFYARSGSAGNFSISIDLLPDMTVQEILSRYNELKLPIKSFLNGIFHPAISSLLLKRSDNIEEIIKNIKNLTFDIKGTYGYDNAQITSGGINTTEINPKTLESLYHKGLYFVGEVINIDGECGGYNLQWAWSSGAVAGSSAAMSLIN